jgi:hypothetical protein
VLSPAARFFRSARLARISASIRCALARSDSISDGVSRTESCKAFGFAVGAGFESVAIVVF